MRHIKNIAKLAALSGMLALGSASIALAGPVGLCRSVGNEKNVFTEVMLFERRIVRDLSKTEKNVYRGPVTRAGGTSLPGIIMPNDIPFDGEPAENTALMNQYSDWLKDSDTPKLFINATQGHGIRGSARICTDIQQPGRGHGERPALHAGRRSR